MKREKNMIKSCYEIIMSDLGMRRQHFSAVDDNDNE